MNITEFLEARIAEDEALATAAIETEAPDRWENPTETLNQWPANIAFWGSQTPYRVLAECAAKRAIVRRFEDAEESYVALSYVIEALAAVYKDHPDYQEEWAVGG